MLTDKQKKLKHEFMEDYFVLDTRENKIVSGWNTHHNSCFIADMRNEGEKQLRYKVINFHEAVNSYTTNREQYI